MNYTLIKEVLDLVQSFEIQNSTTNEYANDIDGFLRWIKKSPTKEILPEPNWEGKETGRSAESAIITMLIHLNRYAKIYGRSIIHHSDFTTQEDFIYLILLKAYGAMTKTDLIKRNVHEKPAGMQVINRLIRKGWARQTNSKKDNRSKQIAITAKGVKTLQAEMDTIRLCTNIVTGDLNHPEKMQLIRLLNRLTNFHHSIYSQNLNSKELLETLQKNYVKN